jgi:hypothetical protein
MSPRTPETLTPPDRLEAEPVRLLDRFPERVRVRVRARALGQTARRGPEDTAAPPTPLWERSRQSADRQGRGADRRGCALTARTDSWASRPPLGSVEEPCDTGGPLSFAKTPSGGQVVDRSALIMPRSNTSGRRSPTSPWCLFRWFVGLSMDDRVWDPTVLARHAPARGPLSTTPAWRARRRSMPPEADRAGVPLLSFGRYYHRLPSPPR